MSRVTSPLLADERQSYFEVDEDDEEWVMEEDDEEVWEENPPSLKRQTSYGVPETSLNKPRGLSSKGGIGDWPWALLYIAHYIGVIILVGRIYPSTTEHILTIKTTQYAINLKTIDVVRFAGVAVGMPLLLTSMWMALMRSKPRAMIRINSALFMLLLVTTVAINAYYGAYYSMALGCLGLWLGVRIIKDKNGENFCVACLQVVNRILNRYPSTVFIPIVAVLVAAAAIIPAFLGLHYAHSQAVDPNTAIDLSRGGAVGLMIAFLFSIFWTVECIYNIVHMTICGTVASYYFFREDERSEHATWHALKRACCPSFGTVCFGACVIAFFKTLRTIAYMFNKDDGLRCLITVLDRVISYFNRYAFVYVALYGGNLMPSAKAAWGLFGRLGWKLVVNDWYLNVNIGVGTFTMASLSGIGVWMISTYTFTDQIVAIDDTADDAQTRACILLAFMYFLVGYVVSGIVLMAIDSGVCALFVCLAEDTTALHHSSPVDYEVLRKAWSKRWAMDVPTLPHGEDLPPYQGTVADIEELDY